MKPFRFCSMAGLVRSVHRHALDLQGLREGVEAVPDASLHYHLHHPLLRRHFQASGVVNDFARWVSEELGDESSAERIAAVDPLAMTSLGSARRILLETLDRCIGASDPGRAARSRFHFAEVLTFVIPTGIEARDIPGLKRGVEETDLATIFVHFIQARLQREEPRSDFALWLAANHDEATAAKVDRLTPCSGGLRNLRDRLLEILDQAPDGGREPPAGREPPS